MHDNNKKRVCAGVLAHVDAGKTTLSEAILYEAGLLRQRGRVDHGDTALDTHALERRRGITIFSAQATMDYGGMELTLLDTPGHVDFSGEMERTLAVLDLAILVISGSDGVQAHTETLWRLLRRYRVPVFLFVTKMDLPAADRDRVLSRLREVLDEHVLDFTHGPPEDEALALCDEGLLDRYLETGGVSESDVSELIASRKLFPCWFGSGLRGEGVAELLDGLDRYALPKPPAPAFGARVFKISRDSQGNRQTHVRVTGGALRVRESLSYTGRDGAALTEKVTALRSCSGAKWGVAEVLEAGETGIILGLSGSYAG
ncbi:MAG: GTP-binding protein, partial [Oscillospiraceae bacterium]|nr:GTP-binding protein [Oscillospiraceae bacterium]